MPWKKRKVGDKIQVIVEATGEVVGTHDSEAEANDQIAALNISVAKGRHSAMRMYDIFEVVNEGQPIRLLPVGTWYRGGRELSLTEDRLKEIVKNFKEGLPRFRVGIDLDHDDASGKVGDVLDLDFLEDGEKGPGVYITQYDLTEKGAKAVKESGYDAVSAEVMWSLLSEDSKYEDPETGDLVDNVLTGVALTPRPFFGHKEVAIFSAFGDKKPLVEPEPDRTPASSDAPGKETTIRRAEPFAEKSMDETVEEIRGAFTPLLNPEASWAYIDEIYDDHVIIEAAGGKYYKAEYILDGGIVRPAPRSEWVEVEKQVNFIPKQEDMMSEDVTNVEELNAARAAEVERLSNEKKELEEKLASIEAERAAERLAARKMALAEEAESFEHLSVDKTDYAEKMSVLEEKDSDLAAWVRAQFKAHDEATSVGEEIGSDAEGDEDPGARFLSAVTQIQKSENLSYTDALERATKEHPDLAAAYAGGREE